MAITVRKKAKNKNLKIMKKIANCHDCSPGEEQILLTQSIL